MQLKKLSNSFIPSKLSAADFDTYVLTPYMAIPVCLMKKILVVLGGGCPRGNTKQLADTFIQGAVDAGYEVEFVSLNSKRR